MRLFKLFLISAVVLFGVTTFLFMLFPSDIRISRVVRINEPKGKIAMAVKDFKTWDGWNLFISNPAVTNKSFSTPSSGMGAFIHSDQVSVTLTGIDRDLVKTHWEQTGGKPFNGTINLVQEQGGTVVVQWYFEFHFKWFPWEKLGSMYYDKRMGPIMEESLLNLKHLVENNQ